MAGPREIPVPKEGYTPLGEHNPFDYCHEYVDGDTDDYSGKKEPWDRNVTGNDCDESMGGGEHY